MTEAERQQVAMLEVALREANDENERLALQFNRLKEQLVKQKAVAWENRPPDVRGIVVSQHIQTGEVYFQAERFNNMLEIVQALLSALVGAISSLASAHGDQGDD